MLPWDYCFSGICALSATSEIRAWVKWFLPLLYGGIIGVALNMFWLTPSRQALQANDPFAFQRLGSVLVVWAILAFSSSRRYLSWIESELDAVKSSIKAYDAALINPEYRVSLDRAIHERARKSTRNLGTLMNGMLVLEVLLLCVGTLQWGYGDLFVCRWHGSEWGVC